MGLAVALAACGSGATDPVRATELAEPPLPPPGAPEPAEPAPPTEVAAEPAAAAPALDRRYDVLLLVDHEEPLLPSEERVLGVIVERLRLRGRDVGRRDLTADERAHLRATLEAERREAPTDGRPEFDGARFRLVVRIPPPRTLRDGQRATRGIAGVWAYRGEVDVPYLQLDVDDASAWRWPEDRWSGWLLSVLASEASS